MLHDDDPAFERPGDSRQANAELIELIAFDDPATLWRAGSASIGRFSASPSGTPWTSAFARAEGCSNPSASYIDSELPSILAVWLSAARSRSTFDWVNDVQATQLRSFPTAFVLVFVMVAIFLGSIRLSLGAMVPTLLPVVVTLGAMGWIGHEPRRGARDDRGQC